MALNFKDAMDAVDVSHQAHVDACDKYDSYAARLEGNGDPFQLAELQRLQKAMSDTLVVWQAKEKEFDDLVDGNMGAGAKAGPWVERSMAAADDTIAKAKVKSAPMAPKTAEKPYVGTPLPTRLPMSPIQTAVILAFNKK